MTQPISVARLGDFRPDFLCTLESQTQRGPLWGFALRGKGLASADGAANVRNNSHYSPPFPCLTVVGWERGGGTSSTQIVVERGSTVK